MILVNALVNNPRVDPTLRLKLRKEFIQQGIAEVLEVPSLVSLFSSHGGNFSETFPGDHGMLTTHVFGDGGGGVCVAAEIPLGR